MARERDPFDSAAVDEAAPSLFSDAVSLAASQVVTLETLTATERARARDRPLGTLVPEMKRLRLSKALLQVVSRGTLGRMSSPGRLAPTARRRLTNRSSGRVNDKVPSSDAGVRAAQLNRWASRQQYRGA